LFSGKSFSSKITRKLTHSQYDHVAMVVTFEDDDEIYLLEATSEGVHLVSWNEIRKYRDQIFSKVVWRRLYTERNDDFCDILGTFIKAVANKKYSISLSKLLTRQSVLVPQNTEDPNNTAMIDDQRTFFCSELIAKCFKTLRLLITSRSCTTIYPKHFSSKKKLELTDAELGEELMITFDIMS